MEFLNVLGAAFGAFCGSFAGQWAWNVYAEFRDARQVQIDLRDKVEGYDR